MILGQIVALAAERGQPPNREIVHLACAPARSSRAASSRFFIAYPDISQASKPDMNSPRSGLIEKYNNSSPPAMMNGIAI